MTTTERLANEFAAVFPHAPSDSLHGHVVAALRKLATWEAEKESEEPPTNIVKTAPERIWLNLFTTDEDTDGELLFPADHEGITWADSEVGDHDVPYIRADLAKASEQQAERLSEIEIGQHRKRCTGLNSGELMPHLFAHAIQDACAAKWGVKLSSQEGAAP